MSFKNKKELKKFWEPLQVQITEHLSDRNKITDNYYFVGWEREPYIGLEINDVWVYFIFSDEHSTIKIKYYSELTIEISEVAAFIKNILVKLLYSKQTKHIQASKAE